MDRTRYQRFFHMLREEDKGYGISVSGACNGYVKIEIKDGKGKLQAFAQNLREPDKGTSYGVYFIKAGDITAMPIRMGILAMQKNKGELTAQFDPDNIKNTGIPIEKIGAYPIVLERGNGFWGNLICPLVAVNEERFDWRLPFNNMPVKKQVIERRLEPVQASEKESVPVQKKEEAISVRDEEQSPDQQERPFKKESETAAKVETVARVESEARIETAAKVETEARVDTAVKIETDEMVESDETLEENERSAREFDYNYSDIQAEIESPMLGNTTDDGDGFAQSEENRSRNIRPKVISNLSNTKEMPQSNNRAAINNIQIEGDVKSEVNMLERVKEALGRHFEEFQPFQRRRISYRWWKVNNPVYLNNVLYVNRVKSPIFFNPLVIMAHFKHKHIIMGIYADRQTEKEYIVCGTPGIYGIDERPFGELCRWMPKEGERPRYGGYGYWVVYIDPSTGRLVTV